MPRQLPWANKGGGSRTQVKQPPKPAKKPRLASDIEDDFFDGTVLASSKKGKEKAEESDNDLPDLPAEPSTPRTRSRTKDATRKRRATSSSPPPIADLEQPPVQRMYKGVSKFELRDDEWMMVEDEFLETAKLFTRHLHIAEYERLKERIEEKKKEVEAARPVVANAKLSIDGAMKEKAKTQEKRQRKAIRDVFATQNEEDGTSTRTTFSKGPSYFASSRVTSTVSKQPPSAYTAQDTDSDDLDAPRPPAKPPVPRATPATNPTPVRHTTAGLKSASSTATGTTAASSTFMKPAIPSSAAKPRSKLSRATPFDMLDDYAPRKSQPPPPSATPQREARTSPPSKTTAKPPSPAKPTVALSTPSNSKIGRSIDPFDEWGSSTRQGVSGMSKETSDRLAKRKAEREKEEQEKEKRKAVRLDDIPTFLF